MAHIHSITDGDPHFKIDPITRKITNESDKVVLVQHDHNSNRISFDMPRCIDGHDMTECDKVEIHYLNLSANKKESQPGIYKVTDLEPSAADDNTATFSWLVSENATQYTGLLIFAVHFTCINEDEDGYRWSTMLYDNPGICVGESIYNSDVIAVQYIDVLEAWKKEIYEDLSKGVSAEVTKESILNALEYNPAKQTDVDKLSEEIAGLKENGTGSNVEPADDDIPKVFFAEAIPQTKDDVVTKFRYISETLDFEGYAEFKAQGNSSMSYPKKNMTVKMYKDAALEEKLKVDFKGWGKQSKHVYKANWIDLIHARNVVSARIWADIVKSRSNYAELPELYRTSPNQGAVDGFPVKVYSQGIYQGRYTLNIPKDAWMANMDDELDAHCILCGEGYNSGCFRQASVSQWTDEVHDSMPATIRTRWLEIINFVMNSTDQEFKANLGNYFFEDSLIDYFIYGMVQCGLDAFGKNQLYFTYDGLRWIAGMYDMDATWGLYWNGSKFVSASYTREQFEDFVSTASSGDGNLLYIRLANLFAAEIKARYEELKRGVLSVPNIINHFERFTDITSLDLVQEDYASTTGGGKFTGIPSRTTNNIQQIRQFVIDRYAYCDEYFDTLGVVVTGISAVYTGEDVAEGTALTDLTGITVTAIYSDGTTKTVTNYTLGGNIVAGENVITVNYGGKTATFTVVGIAKTYALMVEQADGSKKLATAFTINTLDDALDTGIKLFSENKDFTVFVDFNGGGSQLALATVLHCCKEELPYPGISIGIHSGKYALSVVTRQYSDFGDTSTDRQRYVFVKDASTNNIKSYHLKDGNLTVLNNYTDSNNAQIFEHTLLLGCYQTVDGVKGRTWKGTINDCQVWEGKALSDVEITALLSGN